MRSKNVGPLGEILEGELAELPVEVKEEPQKEEVVATEAVVTALSTPSPSPLLVTSEPSPKDSIRRMAEAAKLLKEILEKHPELKPNIPGRGEFYSYGAWQFLGSALGIYATVEQVEEVRDDEGKWRGFRAKAAAYRRDGTLVTTAWGQADIDEKMAEYEYTFDAKTGRRVRGALKGYRPRFEEPSVHTILAIAQTRAARNALRMALQAITVLADWDPEGEGEG